MMEKSLNYEINTYFQDGKPSAIAPVMIEYRTNSGKGTINFDMVRFFPASVHDVKTIIDILWMAPDTYEKAEIIAEYLRNVIADLQIIRGNRENYNNQDCADASKVNGFIKRYKSNLDKIADAFGLETVADDRAMVKMSKCEVIMAESMNGKLYAKSYAGKRFEKSGYVWEVFKFAKGVYRIAMPGTGYYIEEYSGKEKDAPEHITAHLVDRVNALKSKNPGIFENFNEKLRALCEVAEISAPVLPDCMKNTPAENTPAPAPVLDAETSEARPAADQETRTAEKPAKNIIKPGCVRIICTQLRDTKTNKAGDRFEVLKDEYGQWLGDNLRTKKNYAFTESDLCDPELLRIEIQQTADEIKKSLCIIDKPRTAARRDQVPQKPAQVWKPCTMRAMLKNGIIYHDIMGATDRQEPASADRLKAVLRLPKMQGYINLGVTDKNPVTGTERSHKATLNLTAYAHGRPPETRQKSALFALGPRCLTADRRKIKQKSPPEFFKPGVEFTQSSHLKMTKNGTLISQGGAGYQKFYT